MINRTSQGIVLIWVVFTTPSQLLSQKPIEHVLSAPNSRLPAEFTRIVGFRELSDGRVLIADAGDNRIVVADFERRTVSLIGHEGHGPGEYESLRELFAIGADSTLMEDSGNRRWLMLFNDRIVRTASPDTAVTSARGTTRGMDQRGNALLTRFPAERLLQGVNQLGKADSIPLLFIHLGSGRTDTIGQLRISPMKVEVVKNSRGLERIGLRQEPFAVGEEPLLSADGWVAVARLDPYRVDWRAPDGRWIHGVPLPVIAQRVDAREQKALLERLSQSTGKPVSMASDAVWPETVPPFETRPLLPLPNGDVLIRRTPTADHPGMRYDRIDRQGRLVGWVELAPDQRLLGIGRHAAYVVVIDDDGIQRVQRHPWSW